MTSTLPPPETAPSFDAMLAELRELLAKDKPGVWEARTFAGDFGVVRGSDVLFAVDDFDSFDAELVLAAKCRNVMPAVLAERDQMAELLRWRDLKDEALPADGLMRVEFVTESGTRHAKSVGFLARYDRLLHVTHWRPLTPSPCEQR